MRLRRDQFRVLDLLQTARENLGPLQITSAYRCPSHNDSVSSTGMAGPHTTGLAVDIRFKFTT